MNPLLAENHHTDREPPRWRNWVAPLVLCLLITGSYWKLVFTNEYTWLQSGDFANQVLPWFQMQASEWKQGRFPMWDPYQWMGQPLFGQAQPGAAFPPNWLLFNLNLRNGWIRQSYLHWYVVVEHILAALFAYALARDLRRSWTASVLAGCVFSLSSWMASTSWPQMVNGTIWAPLVLLFVLRVLRKVRPAASAAWGGVFLGVAWLSGHHQVPIYISLAAMGVWLHGMFREGLPSRKLVAYFLLFWVIALAAGAFQILPAYEYGKLSVRWIGLDDPVGWDQKVPYKIHSEYSLSPLSILGIIFPGMSTHSDPFLGVAVTLLCLMAIAAAWRRREVRVFAAISLGGLLFGFAHHNVFHGLLYALVPVVEKARNPAMATILFGFGASVVAAFGLDAAREQESRRVMRNLGWGAIGFGLLLFSAAAVRALVKGFEVAGDDRALMTVAASLLCGGLLTGLAGRAVSFSAASTMLIAAFLVESGNVNGYYLPSRYEKNRTEYLASLALDGDVAAFLRQQPGPIRVAVDDQAIPYNFGDWHGIDTSGGYLASMTENLWRQETHSDRARKLFGVGYAVRKQPDNFYTELVFRGATGHNVYRNRDVFPRAFAVHEVAEVKTQGAAGDAMRNQGFDLRKKAFTLGAAPQLETCDGEDRVNVAEHLPNRVVIRARLACRGMVVLTDTWFPGWVATVDGKPAKVLEAYGLVRGVVAEAGVHTIDMRYQPLSVMLGAALSVCALAIAVVLTFRQRE